MEKLKQELDSSSTTRSTVAVWATMGFMSLTFGFFARLTWWEYSWDIMEPVTYFWGYSTAMAALAYFLVTRQVSAFSLSFSLPPLSHPLTHSLTHSLTVTHSLSPSLPPFLPPSPSLPPLSLIHSLFPPCRIIHTQIFEKGPISMPSTEWPSVTHLISTSTVHLTKA